MGMRIRPGDEHWYATVDAAVRAAMRVPCAAIDYGAESLRDGGHSQRVALLRRLTVLACLNGLEPRQRQALVARAHGATWSQAARFAGLRYVRAQALVMEARRLVAEKLREVGLMAPIGSPTHGGT
jgi:DNA-directed RNA polymerase specialized sigma24 family protein